MPGPTKKPTQFYKDNGTYRADRHDSPSLPIGCPSPPDDMSADAMEHWTVLVPMLVQAGYLSENDFLSLRMLCDSYVRYQRASRELETHGYVITQLTTSGETQKLNPVVSLVKSSWTEVVTLSKQFGLTPASRTGMPPQVEEDNDDISDILGIG